MIVEMSGTAQSARTRLKRARGSILIALVVGLALAPGLAAQPFGVWGIFSSSTGAYLQIPHSPALNPTGAITIEAWVSVSANPGQCWSLVGKNFQQAWWVGVCSGTLRSYLRGAGLARDGGTIPPNQWTHIAVTFDGTNRRHYINGELVASWVEPGPLTTSTAPVRIGSDVAFPFTPDGTIDEVRLWNVARTTTQIRQTINVQQTSPRPGLVAVWGLEGPGDNVGSHDGMFVGTVPGLTFPAVISCGTSGTEFLCLEDHFSVRVLWRASPTNSGTGKVVACPNPGSGLFWFFSPDNWELLVKILDGCPVNNHFWVFSAATTNVFYRMEVLDVRAGVQKIYFNYPGPPAPAVTDTQAFATCP